MADGWPGARRVVAGSSTVLCVFVGGVRAKALAVGAPCSCLAAAGLRAAWFVASGRYRPVSDHPPNEQTFTTEHGGPSERQMGKAGGRPPMDQFLIARCSNRHPSAHARTASHLDQRSAWLVGLQPVAQQRDQVRADAWVGHEVAMANEAVALRDLDHIESPNTRACAMSSGRTMLTSTRPSAHNASKQPAGSSERFIVRRNVHGDVKLRRRDDDAGSGASP